MGSSFGLPALYLSKVPLLTHLDLPPTGQDDYLALLSKLDAEGVQILDRLCVMMDDCAMAAALTDENARWESFLAHQPPRPDYLNELRDHVQQCPPRDDGPDCGFLRPRPKKRQPAPRQSCQRCRCPCHRGESPAGAG